MHDKAKMREGEALAILVQVDLIEHRCELALVEVALSLERLLQLLVGQLLPPLCVQVLENFPQVRLVQKFGV